MKRISTNKNVSWTVNSLTVKGDKTGLKNFARLYVGVPIADKIGQDVGQFSMIGLCAFLVLIPLNKCCHIPSQFHTLFDIRV